MVVTVKKLLGVGLINLRVLLLKIPILSAFGMVGSSLFHLMIAAAIIKWNKLDPTIPKAESIGIFKSNTLKFIRPTPRSFLTVTTTKKLD